MRLKDIKVLVTLRECQTTSECIRQDIPQSTPPKREPACTGNPANVNALRTLSLALQMREVPRMDRTPNSRDTVQSWIRDGVALNSHWLGLACDMSCVYDLTRGKFPRFPICHEDCFSSVHFKRDHHDSIMITPKLLQINVSLRLPTDSKCYNFGISSKVCPRSKDAIWLNLFTTKTEHGQNSDQSL